jgi:ankyrin repeat protein
MEQSKEISSEQTVNFNQIPAELQLLILGFLPAKNVLQMGLVSKFLHLLSLNSFLWEELYKNDFNDHYRPLAILQEYEAIDWREQYEVTSKYPKLTTHKITSINPLLPISNTIIFQHIVGINIFSNKLSQAIEAHDVDQVFSLLTSYKADKITTNHLVDACKFGVPNIILEALVFEIKNDLHSKSRSQLDLANITLEKDERINTALLAACKRNNKVAAAILIEAGADVNYIIKPNNNIEYCPLILAIKFGDASLVKMLIDHGAKNNVSQSYPLVVFLLENKHHFKSVSELSFWDRECLNHPFNLDTGELLTPFQLAFMQGCLTGESSSISWLMMKLNQRGELLSHVEKSAIIEACFDAMISGSSGTWAHAAELFEEVLNQIPNIVSLEGEILHQAVEILPLDLLRRIVPALARVGFNLAATNDQGQTILHVLLSKYNDKTYILDSSLLILFDTLIGSADIHDKNGVSPLELATESRNVSALITLILRNVLPANTCFERDNNILHLLVLQTFFEKKDVLDLNTSLVKNFIPIPIIHRIRFNFDDNSPVVLFENDQIEIYAKWLQCTERHKMLSETTNSGATKSVIEQNIIRLVKAGVDLNKVNADGKSPLQLAIEKQDVVLVECLLENGACLDFKIHCNNSRINDLLIMYLNLKDALTHVSKEPLRNFSFTASSCPDIQIHIDQAISRNLGRKLLFDYLITHENNLPKIRLLKHIILSDSLTFDFCRSLVTLAREGKYLKLPPELMKELLQKNLFLAEKRCSNFPDDRDILERARQLLLDFSSDEISSSTPNIK